MGAIWVPGGRGGGGGGSGALILGPTPNSFATTALRDAAGMAPTSITYDTSIGSWQIAGGAPGTSGIQINVSLRVLQVDVQDRSFVNHADTLNAGLVGQHVQLWIDASNFINLQITGYNGITRTGVSLETHEFTFATGFSLTGSLTTNFEVEWRPEHTVVAGPRWLAEYDAKPEYAVLVTNPNPDQIYTRRSGAWVQAAQGFLKGDKGDKGDTGGMGIQGEVGPMGEPGGAPVPELRIGHVDSVSVTNANFRQIPLDEDIAATNDYQVIVTDDSTGNSLTLMRFSGERFLAKPVSSTVPTAISNSIESVLSWRESVTAPSQPQVGRWALVKGRTNSELYIVGQNSGDLGPLTIEVFKYPRTGAAASFPSRVEIFSETLTASTTTRMRQLDLDENLSGNNFYGISVRDTSSNRMTVSPLFAGEELLALPEVATTPTTLDGSTNFRGVRENSNGLNQVALFIFNIWRRTNGSLWFHSEHLNVGGELEIKVYKYSRGGQRGPAGAGHGAVYFFHAKGSTERFGNEFPNTINPVSNRARLEFKSDDPDERFYSDTNPASWWVASPTNLDATGTPAITTARVVFKPPAGTWRFTLQYKASAQSTSAGVGLFEIQASTDDNLITEQFADATTDGFGATTQISGRLESDEIVTDGTREFYFMGRWSNSTSLNYYLRATEVS